MSLELRARAIDELSLDDERELLDLMGRAFPDVESARERWYYDTRPSFVVEARADGALVGMRMVIERVTSFAGRELRVGGIGIGVDPAWQRRGVGTVLTRRVLHELRARKTDLVLGFLLSDNARKLLENEGFRRLAARVHYVDRKTGAEVTEPMACFALALVDDALVDEIDAAGLFHLGLGTW